jgi:hypothetical protein
LFDLQAGERLSSQLRIEPLRASLVPSLGGLFETGGKHRPIGILTEAHAMRRYAEASEQWRREVVGDI